MLNVLNKIVAQRKQCTFSNSIKTTQKKPSFSYFIKLCEYWGTFQSSYETKKSSMEKIMRLILGEVITSDRHMSDGQMHLFLQLFLTLEKLG